MNHLRWMAKRLAEVGLTRAPMARLWRARARKRVVILGYHNVIPDEEVLTGNPSSHLRFSQFREHLDILESEFEVIDLDELIPDLLERPDAATPRAVLTFDDAYAGTLRHALPELVRREIPSTVFVPSNLVGTPAFWWDELEVTGWEQERTPLDHLRGDAQAIRRWARDAGMTFRIQGPNQRPGSEEDLRAAAANPGVRFGVHSANHPNLARLEDNEIRTELLDGRRWLEAMDLPLSSWVAYPYGLSSKSVEAITEALGFGGGLRITGGAITSIDDGRFRTPRALIPASVSQENFLLRCFGVVSS